MTGWLLQSCVREYVMKRNGKTQQSLQFFFGRKVTTFSLHSKASTLTPASKQSRFLKHSGMKSDRDSRCERGVAVADLKF